MKKHILNLLPVVLCALALAFNVPTASAADAKKFRVAWSIYAGWMPWGYAADHGIVAKWAKKYGIDIEVVQINDYVESINQYTAGAFAGCVMTNMDMLTIPAAGGVDSTALIVGDFSNGNDAVILKKPGSLKDIKGLPVNLVELSVSHYLLARGLESVGFSERDIKVVNTSDADIVGAYASSDVKAVVTWKPQVSEIAAIPGANIVFDSSQIPGEIIDLMVVNTKTLRENPALGKALTGAWYETITLMSKNDTAGKAARAAMGQASGTDLKGYEGQLATTRLFYQPKEAAAFVHTGELIKTMDDVRQFSLKHGLLGEGVSDPDAIGMAFPGGKTLGNPKNIKLRFIDSYMQMAADGKL